MTRDEIIRMAMKSGFAHEVATGHIVATSGYTEVICTAGLERFAALVAAAEREKAARWLIQRSYATGHGDSIEMLLTELEWQIRESEREACAVIAETPVSGEQDDITMEAKDRVAAAIRARSNT